MKFVAGIGGANVDLHGRANGPVLLRDSNPGHLHLSCGGVMRNILENLARLGVPTAIASAVGDDGYGRILADSCRQLGMDTRLLQVLPGQRSSCYVSILDDEGDMLVAMSDMEIIKGMEADFVAGALPVLNQAELVVCDANLSFEALRSLTENCTRPLFLDPVSTAWAGMMAPLAGRFDTLKPNRMELQALTGCDCSARAGLEEGCCQLLKAGAKRVFVSLGAEGIYYRDCRGVQLHAASRPFPLLRNATGAGDAAMAGIVWATLRGESPLRTVQCAIGASLCALSAENTIDEEISAEKIETMIKEYVV